MKIHKYMNNMANKGKTKVQIVLQYGPQSHFQPIQPHSSLRSWGTR